MERLLFSGFQTPTMLASEGLVNDPMIDEVRRVRMAIAAEFDSELNGMVEHYAKIETRFKSQPILPTDRRTKHGTEVAEQPVTHR